MLIINCYYTTQYNPIIGINRIVAIAVTISNTNLSLQSLESKSILLFTHFISQLTTDNSSFIFITEHNVLAYESILYFRMLLLLWCSLEYLFSITALLYFKWHKLCGWRYLQIELFYNHLVFRM